MFLPDNELHLSDVNNNDSIADEKKTKEELKIGPSNGFYVKSGIHKFLRRTIGKSKDKRNKLNQ